MALTQINNTVSDTAKLTANNASFLGGVPAANYALTANLPSGGFSNMQVFTSSGTFTVPTGITKVKVTVVGGGGGGQGFSVGGGAGGTSSFGAHCSATGGNGTAPGNNGTLSPFQGTPGIGSGGNINIRGMGAAGEYSGFSIFLGAGRRAFPTLAPVANSGAGGYGGEEESSLLGGPAGGAAIKIISGLTPGSTVSVTVGSGGTAGNSGAVAGAAGIVVVEW
jgi:hypothetical protein